MHGTAREGEEEFISGDKEAPTDPGRASELSKPKPSLRRAIANAERYGYVVGAEDFRKAGSGYFGRVFRAHTEHSLDFQPELPKIRRADDLSLARVAQGFADLGEFLIPRPA